MELPKKYDKAFILSNTDFNFNEPIPPEKKLIAFGVLKKFAADTQYGLNIDFYSGVYIISGTGIYIDKTTRKTFAVYPGCFIQRIPNRSFDTIIDKKGQWQEIFININKDIFLTGVKLGIFSDEPVLYLGNNLYVFDEFLNNIDEFKMTPKSDYPTLMFKACTLLFQINQVSKKNTSHELNDVVNHLNLHLNVDEKLPDIIKVLNLNYERVRKQFKKTFDISLSDYIIKKRIDVSKKLLFQGFSIKEISSYFHYCDEFSFIKQFKSITGITPKQYVKQIESADKKIKE